MAAQVAVLHSGSFFVRYVLHSSMVHLDCCGLQGSLGNLNIRLCFIQSQSVMFSGSCTIYTIRHSSICGSDDFDNFIVGLDTLSTFKDSSPSVNTLLIRVLQ